MKIAILGTSDIAVRRFLPALAKDKSFEYIGTASRDADKADNFAAQHGGRAFRGYEAALAAADVEAVYLPLPPALHYEWAKKALAAGKHVMLEKPSTASAAHTADLVAAAEKKGLSLTENYMFVYHNQLSYLRQAIESGSIGTVRHIRINFGFPRRPEGDFRYSKELGGGALLDCGGYCIRLAWELLGKTTRITASALQYDEQSGVDIFGGITLENDEKIVVQAAFGMDNSYKCELEIWGSSGCIHAPRIFTAPPEFEAEVVLTAGNNRCVKKIPPDDQFLKSIQHFKKCVENEELRQTALSNLNIQATLVEQALNHATKEK
jgi:predicted dehydrogenase